MLFFLLGIFIACLFIFAALAFFLPEWIGITGKKAQDITRHQRGDLPNTEAPEHDSEDSHR